MTSCPDPNVLQQSGSNPKEEGSISPQSPLVAFESGSVVLDEGRQHKTKMDKSDTTTGDESSDNYLETYSLVEKGGGANNGGSSSILPIQTIESMGDSNSPAPEDPEEDTVAAGLHSHLMLARERAAASSRPLADSREQVKSLPPMNQLVSRRKILLANRLLCLVALVRRRRRLKRVIRRHWVHPILKRRKEQGEFCTLFQELKGYPDKFRACFRLLPYQFDLVLHRINHRLVKNSLREPVSPEEKLAVTLKYLATGQSAKEVASAYRLGHSTVCTIVLETCVAIWEELGKEYVSLPKSEQEWKQIADDFWNLWDFPNCIGAIDGKHIQINCPPRSGSLFYNYKHTFSTVLLAVVDAKYCFTYIDIGSYGKNSDGGIFASSALGQALENKSLQIPADSNLPNSNLVFPYYLVGDEAFPLKSYLMRPYPGHRLSSEQDVFNYRMCRARRIVENGFGILAARWRIFRKPIEALPSRVDWFVKATITLHNFLMKSCEREIYCPQAVVDGYENMTATFDNWKTTTTSNAFARSRQLGSNNSARVVRLQRERLARYLSVNSNRY